MSTVLTSGPSGRRRDATTEKETATAQAALRYSALLYSSDIRYYHHGYRSERQMKGGATGREKGKVEPAASAVSPVFRGHTVQHLIVVLK